MTLKNKTAVVTGGCGGVGRATAEKFIAAGARVVITDLDDARGGQLAQEIGAEFFRQDVSEEVDWLALRDHLLEQGSGLHILVNNAAILRADNVVDETLDNFNRVMAVNCNSVFLGTKTLLPVLAENGGAIVNVSSTSALMGFPQFCAYSASKAAVRSLTMSTAVLAKQQQWPVRCNSVHPDGIATPMVMDIPGSPVQLSPEQAAHAASFGCLPDAVADVIVFLASEESRHINGAAIAVDNTSTIHAPYL